MARGARRPSCARSSDPGSAEFAELAALHLPARNSYARGARAPQGAHAGAGARYRPQFKLREPSVARSQFAGAAVAGRCFVSPASFRGPAARTASASLSATQPRASAVTVLPSAPIEPAKTAFVILEYCGGSRTDALFEQISAWNPQAQILVLDNASPDNAASSTTHRNSVNSFVGGGIRDAIALVEARGASYLFFCVNDIDILNPISIAEFEAIMEMDPDLVMLSCSVTPDSTQAKLFPWMMQRDRHGLRQVRLADILCCVLRLDFIRSFGGFPSSKAGWGYAAELAYHARRLGKKIYVRDSCAVRHFDRSTGGGTHRQGA